MNQKLYDTINNLFGVDIKKDTKKGEVVVARQLYFYVRRKNTILSLKEIGKELNRNHATVIWAIKRIEKVLTKPKDKWHNNCVKILKMFDKKQEELTLIEENNILLRRIEKLKKKFSKTQTSGDFEYLINKVRELPEDTQQSVIVRLDAILRMEKSKVMNYKEKRELTLKK